MKFIDWIICPSCGADNIGVLSHDTDMVFECYECGLISEFTIGEDVPLNDLNPEKIRDSEQRGDGD